MNREILEKFATENGGHIALLQALQDFYLDLSLDWDESEGQAAIADSFESASHALAEVKEKLARAEESFSRGEVLPKVNYARIEYDELAGFFRAMNTFQLFRYSVFHWKDFNQKSRRLQDLFVELFSS